LLRILAIYMTASFLCIGATFEAAQINIDAISHVLITLMYEAIRGAMTADDAITRKGTETRFRIRETPEWKLHAADLETEMLKRGMMFEVIDWSEERG
jgi:hypothetical protein